jgi:hypothetical protein
MVFAQPFFCLNLMAIIASSSSFACLLDLVEKNVNKNKKNWSCYA